MGKSSNRKNFKQSVLNQLRFDGHNYDLANGNWQGPPIPAAPEEGFAYQDIHSYGMAFSTLRPSDVRQIQAATARGGYLFATFLLHFTDRWNSELAQLLARGCFRSVHRDEFFYIAILQLFEARNVDIARTIVDHAIGKEKLEWSHGLQVAEEGFPRLGKADPRYSLWERILLDANAKKLDSILSSSLEVRAPNTRSIKI